MRLGKAHSRSRRERAGGSLSQLLLQLAFSFAEQQPRKKLRLADL
jgi:hypothetical protein